LSGRRPDTTKILDNNTPPRTTIGDIPFVFEYFKRHGYFTARVGKILHGRFADAGKWDVSEEPKGKASKEEKKALKEPGEGALKITWLATNRDDADEVDGMTARRIVQLLEKNKDGPFFIAAGFHKPHLPFVAPKKYFDMYPWEKIQLPRESADVRQGVPPVAYTRTKGDEAMTEKEKKQGIAGYYAATSFMDAQVGLLLDAMDRLGLWENTIVIFFGDHGFHLADHGGLWRKMTLFERATRVPLIIAAPGTKGGVVSPRLAELVDLYPTLTDSCKLPSVEGMEGTSLVPLLEQPDRPWKKGAFTVVNRGKGVQGRTVRTERYRYTEWGSDKLAELYDHDNDPDEYINLAANPSHAATVAELRRLLQEGWRAAVPAVLQK
jgi:uncharacterized sulfatase